MGTNRLMCVVTPFWPVRKNMQRIRPTKHGDVQGLFVSYSADLLGRAIRSALLSSLLLSAASRNGKVLLSGIHWPMEHAGHFNCDRGRHVD